MSKGLKIFLCVLAVIIIGAGLVFYFFLKNANNNNEVKGEINYLIPGVPYHGFYDHFFDADSLVVSSVADVLGYWGDERFNIQDLISYFPDSLNRDNTVTTTVYTSLNIQSFFENNGYETYRWASDKAGGELNEIKKFVNLSKKIPVIVYQKRSDDSDHMAVGFRVVIGIFDNTEKIIVHDHDYGNNYEISYQNFEKMFQPNARAILAVWPSNELAAQLSKPTHSSAYPPRLKVMDEMGNLLIKGADAIGFWRQRNYQRAITLEEEFVNDPKFNDFSPAHRIRFYTFLSRLYLSIGNIEKAKEVLINKVGPINNNLSLPYGEWTEQISYFRNNRTEDKSEIPFAILAGIYFTQGDQKKSLENLEIATRIKPTDASIYQAYEKLKNLKK